MGKRITDLTLHTNLLNDDKLVIMSNDTTLSTTLSELNEYINEVNDLSTISANAAKGATALQSVPSEYAKKTDVPSIEGLASEEYVDAKIADAIIIAINTEY